MTDIHTQKRNTQQGGNEQLLQLVGFTIGKEQFGVDILKVQEVIRTAPITSVPNSPEFVEGIINLRGNIVPVIELRKRLNLYRGGANEDTWIMILNIDGKITGLIVDSVTRVLKVLEGSIEPPPDLVIAGMASKYIRGVCDIGDGLLIILDFNHILLGEELQKLKEFGD